MLNLMGALAASGLAPRRLELKVTEAVLMHDETALDILHQLRGIGVRIALDDFRDGILLSELSTAISVRQDQDRPNLHQGRMRTRRVEDGWRRMRLPCPPSARFDR